MAEDKAQVTSAEQGQSASGEWLGEATTGAEANDEALHRLVNTLLEAACKERHATRELMDQGHDVAEVEAIKSRVQSALHRLDPMIVHAIAVGGSPNPGLDALKKRVVDDVVEPELDTTGWFEPPPSVGLAAGGTDEGEEPQPEPLGERREPRSAADDDAALHELDTLIEDLEAKLPSMPHGL